VCDRGEEVEMSSLVDYAVPFVVGLFGLVAVLVIVKATGTSENGDDGPVE
jgi:hypothetical protein